MYNYGKESGDIPGEYTIEVALDVTWPTDIFNSEISTIKIPFQWQQEYNGTTYELGYEHCISLTNGWFWSEGSYPMSIGELNAVWDKVCDLKGNFLLNVPPDKTGQIPDNLIQRLNDFNPFADGSLSIENDINISKTGFILSQNYPNPFYHSTTIEYYLPASCNVILKVYSIAGREIETLVNEYQFAGEHKIFWRPKRLPDGVYFYKIQSGDFSETRKILLEKNIMP
jgi:hypothetical protein